MSTRQPGRAAPRLRRHLRHRGLSLWPADHPALMRFKACAAPRWIRCGPGCKQNGRSASDHTDHDCDTHGPRRKLQPSVPVQCKSDARPPTTLTANAALSLLNDSAATCSTVNWRRRPRQKSRCGGSTAAPVSGTGGSLYTGPRTTDHEPRATPRPLRPHHRCPRRHPAPAPLHPRPGGAREARAARSEGRTSDC